MVATLKAIAAGTGIDLSGIVPPGAGTTVGPAGDSFSVGDISLTIHAAPGTDVRAVESAARAGVVDAVDRGIGAR